MGGSEGNNNVGLSATSTGKAMLLKYSGIYGELFRLCPGLRGLIFVGESIEFPSRDTHVAQGRCDKTDIDGIPKYAPSRAEATVPE